MRNLTLDDMKFLQVSLQDINNSLARTQWSIKTADTLFERIISDGENGEKFLKDRLKNIVDDAEQSLATCWWDSFIEKESRKGAELSEKNKATVQPYLDTISNTDFCVEEVLFSDACSDITQEAIDIHLTGGHILSVYVNPTNSTSGYITTNNIRVFFSDIYSTHRTRLTFVGSNRLTAVAELLTNQRSK